LSPIGDEDRACREGEDRSRERPLRAFFPRVSSICQVCCSWYRCETIVVVCRCRASCVKYFLSCLGVLLVFCQAHNPKDQVYTAYLAS